MERCLNSTNIFQRDDRDMKAHIAICILAGNFALIPSRDLCRETFVARGATAAVNSAMSCGCKIAIKQYRLHTVPCDTSVFRKVYICNRCIIKNNGAVSRPAVFERGYDPSCTQSSKHHGIPRRTRRSQSPVHYHAVDGERRTQCISETASRGSENPIGTLSQSRHAFQLTNGTGTSSR